MCTVSWSRRPGGYDLFFNRDELNTRAPEQPPARQEQAGTSFLAPRDGDHGGTWLLANEFGLTVCLLNDYANRWRPSETGARHSRGHLVLACAAAESPEDVAAIANAQPLGRTLPFQLVTLAPDAPPLVLHWTGSALVRNYDRDLRPPLSSSSYATNEVIALRTWRFAFFVRGRDEPDPADLAAYHRQYYRGSGPHSVLMHRPDAATRSICHVCVDEREVRLDYQPVRWKFQGPDFGEMTAHALARRMAACEL